MPFLFCYVAILAQATGSTQAHWVGSIDLFKPSQSSTQLISISQSTLNAGAIAPGCLAQPGDRRGDQNESTIDHIYLLSSIAAFPQVSHRIPQVYGFKQPVEIVRTRSFETRESVNFCV